MLLMVHVSCKNFIVETEDDPDLTSEDEGRISTGKGCLKTLKGMRLSNIFHPDYNGLLMNWETSAEFDARALKMGFPMHWIKKRNLLKMRCASKKRVLYQDYCRKWLRVNW